MLLKIILCLQEKIAIIGIHPALWNICHIRQTLTKERKHHDKI